MVEVDALLEAVLKAPIGLGVRCSDPEALQRRLHFRRAELRAAGNLVYEGVKTRLNPKDQFELFILNGSPRPEGAPRPGPKSKEDLDARRESGLRSARNPYPPGRLPSLAELLSGPRNALEGDPSPDREASSKAGGTGTKGGGGNSSAS